jgi:hypothetical protein
MVPMSNLTPRVKLIILTYAFPYASPFSDNQRYLPDHFTIYSSLRVTMSKSYEGCYAARASRCLGQFSKTN